MENPIIKWGQRASDGKGEKVTHNVTAISVDARLETVTFVIKKGSVVVQVNMYIEGAIAEGIINFKPLLKHIK